MIIPLMASRSDGITLLIGRTPEPESYLEICEMEQAWRVYYGAFREKHNTHDEPSRLSVIIACFGCRPDASTEPLGTAWLTAFEATRPHSLRLERRRLLARAAQAVPDPGR